MDELDEKKASAALVKPHSALQTYARLPDAVPGQIRGMALIDSIDYLLAQDELTITDQKKRELRTALVRERIDQNISVLPQYALYIEEINELVRQIQAAVELHQIDSSENIPFYRLLKAQIIKKQE